MTLPLQGRDRRFKSAQTHIYKTFSDKMKIVIKIGGSVAISSSGPKPEYFEKLIPVLNKIKNKHLLYIVIGGGKITRDYYNCIKNFISHDKAEWVLIDLLHANARFLAYALNGKFISKLDELDDSLCVASGFEPGHSTDGSAAMIAEKINADLLLILTDVNGIYDDDIKRNPDAKLLKHLSFNELDNFEKDGSPNNYGIIDKLAIKTIKKNKIKTYVINGNPTNILKVLNGENPGTVID